MNKAIILDWDDTLIDFEYWQRTKWLYTNQWVENQLGIKDFDLTFWKRYDVKSLYYLHKVRDVLLLLGYDEVDDLESIINNQFKISRGEDLIHKDVELFLKKLTQNQWKIALLTMGKREMHEPRIKATKLDKYFDVIKYGDIDSKPSMIPFLECIEELKCELPPVVVGDDQRDLLAPYNLGMEVIAIDHKGIGKYTFNEPIKTVKSFKELEQILFEGREQC